MPGKIVRRAGTFVAGIAVAALAGWALWPQPIPVDMATIGQGTLEVTVEDEGMTRIREVYTVSAPIGGKMRRIELHAGDDVVANESIVASIEPTDPTFLDVRAQRINEAGARAARAAVTLAEAELKRARAQADFARSDLRRAEDLFANSTISTRALERAKLDVDSAEAAVASAMATLEVRRRELESATASLIQPGEAALNPNACCINVMAPVDGQILKIIAESEQVVQAGSPILEIGDRRDLEVVVDFLSNDVVRIRPGARAYIESWGGDGVLQARAKRIEPTAFTKVSALGIDEQRVEVVLDFTDPHEAWAQLGHGYRVIVRVVLWAGEDVLLVPLSALYREGEDWAVFVVSDGRAQKRIVRIGERDRRAAQLLDGLAAGEKVILHPSDRVDDGVRVEQRRIE